MSTAVTFTERQAPDGPDPQLPDPEPLVERLSLCVTEILLGLRQPEQVARWLDEDTYLHLLNRVLSVRRMREAMKKKPPTGIEMSIQSIRCVRVDNAVEAVTVITTAVRGRAVAMRLEPLQGRWRATSLVVL